MKQQKIYSTLIFLFGILFFAKGQSTVLDSYVKEGINNNLTLKDRQLSYEKSQEALLEAKGLFYPNLSFNASYQLAAGGRTLDFPIGDLLNPIYGTLNQLTGAEQFPTNIENLNEQLLASDFHDTKLRLIQPLFNTDIYFNYKAKQELVSLELVKKQAYEQELTKEIKTAYYQYLQTMELIKIYEESEIVLQELLRVNKKLVANQKATNDVVFSAEYELSKLAKNKAIARKNQQVAQAYFNFLLNRSLDAPIEVDEAVVLAANVSTLEDLKKQAALKRLELEQLKFAMGANQQLVQMNDYAKYPKLNLVTDGGFQGFGYTFDQNQDYIFMQVGLEWNIFDGYQRKAKKQQAELQGKILENEYRRVQQQIELQVRQAFYELEAAQAGVFASESEIKNANQRFWIIKKKYEQNQANLLEFLDAENAVSNAKKSLTINKYNYLIQQVNLDWVSGKE